MNGSLVSLLSSALVAAILSLTAMAGFAQAQAAKKPKPDVGDGHIAWFDVTTTDMARSKEFYGKLFGWQFTTIKGAEQFAAEIVASGKPIGTLRVAEGAISAFNGVPYVQVADMMAACKKVRDLGGKVVEGFPFNLDDEGGSVGLFADPVGHPMGIYSRTPVPAPPAAK